MIDLPRGEAGLYIHIPICLSKCRYCGFYSVQKPAENAVTRLVDCLCREIESAQNKWTVFDTVYWGGGTPSLLERRHIERLTQAIEACFVLAKGAEITLEINPGNVTRETLGMWLENGINRFSLGVQSLDSDVLQFLGRRHDRDRALAALEWLQNASVGASGASSGSDLNPVTYSVDLLMGIPGQEFGAYKESLQNVCEYTPHHLSCYQLSVEPSTQLAADVSSGKVKMVAEDVEADQFEWTHDYLSELGYRHYEISNYAHQEKYYSRHNLKYWFRERYLGIGPAAHSFDGLQRWWNIDHLEKYCRLIETQGAAISGWEQVDCRMERVEKLFLSMRTQWGINKSEIENNEAMVHQVSRLVQTGFLAYDDNNAVHPTKKGLAMADAIAERLVACL